MEIIIGRNGDQPFAIHDRSVSGRHLKLATLADGNVRVEDLGSSNGTFINDLRVIRKDVSRNTIVRMGPTYTFCIKDVIPEVVPTPPPVPKPASPIRVAPPPPPPARQQPDYELARRFMLLEAVWEDYQRQKIDLQKNNASKGFLRMMPMFILGGMGYLVSCMPSLANFRAAITLGGLGVGIVITWMSYKSTTNLPEQMERLNQELQVNYVCPKCKKFLGFTPFTGLKNIGQCSACKAQWIISN